MAPWPDQDNELKAPDKNKTDDHQPVEILKSKSEPPEDKKFLTDHFEEDGQSETKKKDVHSLDDGQLKALLDEAIQYKNPKDREGKSKIFRELLQKVEDEIDCTSPVVGFRRKFGRNSHTAKEGNRNVTVAERVSRGGSLQNIFHAASTAEFETHHTSGTRKKNKRQSPGSSVSSRQREGGSLPSNVNAGWTLESWQSDQIRKKGLFDRDSQQQNHISTGLGNTASGFSSSVASSTPQARRQTVMHSTSNELTSRKQNSGELYPIRRHHSNSDQSKSAEVASSKLKQQSDNSSMVTKMPQISKLPDCFYLDMDFSLEMKPCGESDPAPCLDKKVLRNFNKKFRITPCGIESENTNNNNNNNNNNDNSNSNNSNSSSNYNNNNNNDNNTTSEVFTSKASFEVEPVDTALGLDFVNGRKVNIDLELKGNPTLSEEGNQGRMNDQGGLRSQKYRNSISLVHISPKSTNESSRTDENGNALNSSNLSTRGSTFKKNKNHKRKQFGDRNVVLSVSQNIAGYRGRDKLEDLLNFIESDNHKSKQLKKTLTKGKKHEKKRQNIQKCTSLEEISQRNIEDLTEVADNQRNGRKQKVGNNDEGGSRERRSLGEQVCPRSESHYDVATEQADENNSDSEFQMVTKKQRKRRINDQNQKRIRTHRSSKRSPRRKSTSSVPPSERSGDSDLDSIHSLPVVGGGVPVTSYADIAAGNSNFFNSKGIQELGTFNEDDSNQTESGSARNNEIEEWCNSVSQQIEKNDNNNSNNNNKTSNNNNSNNNNENNYIYNKNNINNNTNNNISYLKNFKRQDDKKPQTLGVDQNGICDTNVKKLKDLVIVDNSVVDSEVTEDNKVVEPPLKNDFKVASNCDLNQCKNVDSKNIEVKKNWSKKDFSREDFPSLPVKSENSNFHKTREINEPNAFAFSDGHKLDWNSSKTLKKIRAEGDIRNRRGNRSKSVGPNGRPAVILLHDERAKEAKDTGMCEITFGFEVNEQLLTSDPSNRIFEEESEGTISPVSTSRENIQSVSGKKDFENETNNVNSTTSNGNAVYNDVIDDKTASKGDYVEVDHGTVQNLFKRPEAVSKFVQTVTHACTTASATSIANKYVPPIAPVDFNHDKIVTFVGMAWEDVMKNGKIQYYSGEK